jgi:hypothetical protein
VVGPILPREPRVRGAHPAAPMSVRGLCTQVATMFPMAVDVTRRRKWCSRALSTGSCNRRGVLA